MTADPSPARLKSWESKTRTVFDLLEAEPSMQKEIVCPQCHTRSFVRESDEQSRLLRTLDELLSSQHSSRTKGMAMPNSLAPPVPLDHAVSSLRPPPWESLNLLKICSGMTAQIILPLRRLTFYLTIPHLIFIPQWHAYYFVIGSQYHFRQVIQEYSGEGENIYASGGIRSGPGTSHKGQCQG